MQKSDVMYHIGLKKEDIKNAKYAILTGDPGRVSKIAKKLNDAIKIGQNREYTSYLGKINNENILVISTGIGGASTAICVEELAMLGIKNLIRIGTCGGMQLDIKAGDIIIANAAIRQDGTSKEYIPIEFPAVSNIEITNALKEAADELGYINHVGIVQCKDSFYGQHEPDRMPVSNELNNKWEAWIKGGTLASEMESATIFTLASILNLKAGTVLLTVWNQEREKRGLDNNMDTDTSKEIDVAIKAISKLIEKKN